MTAAFASLARRPRPAVPQRHAGARSSRRTIRRSSAWPRSAAQELATLVGHVDLALGDSEYNRQELEALGFAPHRRLPDRRRHRAHHAAGRAAGARADSATTASSTSCSSAASRRTRRSRITSGWPSSTSATSTPTTASSSSAATTCVPRYYAMIRALMTEYQMLQRSLHRSPARCPTRSSRSTTGTPRVYISLSEHEGFCVPLVEAMAADVPVLAYAAAAVPDTLGGAGVQFAPKDLEYAAELLGALAFDDDLRARRDRRPAPAARRLRRRAHRRASCTSHRSQHSSRENRLHRPALRHRDARRIRAPLPADRRAARAASTRSTC